MCSSIICQKGGEDVRFTGEEFNIMVNELLYKEPISFDMLCKIAEKTLMPTVVNWCNAEDCLRGRGYERDIMQEIHLRLIKTTVSYFLLRNGTTSYNNDPEGFEDWMFRVADNIKRDFANKIRAEAFKTADVEESVIMNISSDDGNEYDRHTETLSQIFSTVLSLDIGVYKILTWIAQFVLVLGYNITKIKSNELIIAMFADKSLYEMYDTILMTAKKIPWIQITEKQNEKILTALRKTREGNVLYGETAYKTFFMKNGGEISGKKSISDWINRVNGIIRRKTFAEESLDKKALGRKNKEKRRSGDDASNC